MNIYCLVKDRKSRGAKMSKAFHCLFVCMSCKAVHLELVPAFTILKRFISRRGKPSNIFSDDGTNFIGARCQLQEICDFLCSKNEVISNSSINERIKWHVIPAWSPTFGSLWKVGIKSCKFHLKRVIEDSVITSEDFYTVLCKVESIILRLRLQV